MESYELAEQYRAYMNDQARRIAEFREEVMAKQGVELGAFPYSNEITPNVKHNDVHLTHITEDMSDIQSEVEQQLTSNMIVEVERQRLNPDMLLDGVDKLRNMNDLDEVETIVFMTHAGEGVDSDEEAANVVYNTISELSNRDNAYLTQQRQFFNDGVQFGKSPDEVALENGQSNMDVHYSKPGNIRDSIRMEELLFEQEQHVRSIDATFDKMLKLEEQGVYNPLRDADVELEDVDPNADLIDQIIVDSTNISKNDRSLLKDLLNRKERGNKRPPSNQNDLNNDLDM